MSIALRHSLFSFLAWLPLVPMLAGCGKDAVPTVEVFLERHWNEPLQAQGAPPSHFSELESSLDPAACGQCHADQYAQWQTALHSHTMGPGILWQFDLMGQAESNKCMRCHAPLAEQKALLARRLGWENAPASPPPAYVPEDLADRGLVCAACHVRGHQRFGPGKAAQDDDTPHGGFAASAAFKDSRFCAHCHQFPEGGPRLNGKLREDTYQQWLASPYAGKQTCQDCHMPEGRHLWRGVHDPDMMRKALAVELRLTPVGPGEYRVAAIAHNQGAGHHLPTYMVPKIDLVLHLHSADGTAREIGRDVIGWQADMEMTREEFDTRLPAGASRRFERIFKAPAGDWHVELHVEVAPREHYERMFRHHLNTLSMPATTSATLKTAIAEAVSTRYTAMRIEVRP